ncbi:MAG: hypothetical protein QME60_01565 [Verrucomicrobiota bacterium]|nr:hypothetical protein [Verrucomicrobiota bacterium]
MTIFRQHGGDSLAGRYDLFHLWSFTLAELGGKRRTLDEFPNDPSLADSAPGEGTQETWDNLCGLSGFPEPYLSGRETAWRRWSNGYTRQLIRAVSTWNDLGLGSFSLHYVRNKEKQEVDFLPARARAPILLVEAKLADEHPSPALIKFQESLSVPAVQVTAQPGGYKIIRNGQHRILVTPVWRWASGLPRSETPARRDKVDGVVVRLG